MRRRLVLGRRAGRGQLGGEIGELADMTAEIAAMGPSPEDEVATHEALVLAGRRLSLLGDKYGPIFKMRFADGYSEAEIADELDLNVATVKTRAYRARAALREEIVGINA